MTNLIPGTSPKISEPYAQSLTSAGSCRMNQAKILFRNNYALIPAPPKFRGNRTKFRSLSTISDGSCNNNLSTHGKKNDLTIPVTKFQKISNGTRRFSAQAEQQQSHRRRNMTSWEIHSFSGPEGLVLTDSARVPTIRSSQEILVKVKAASLNPIDVAMSKGYGAEMLASVRKLEKGKLPKPYKPTIDFPITLGRDFAGTVVEKGSGVDNVNVGDEVYGVLGFTEHGSLAEYTVARSDLVRKKPSNLTFVEAASIPYVGLTCWSALKITGNYLRLENTRFLVLGGSGGVGTFAIQYLLANRAKVLTTCSTDAIPELENLGGFGIAVDYTQPDLITSLKSNAPFDCILNLSGPRSDISQYLPLLKPGSGQYITLSPPLLANFDNYGFIGGAVKNALEVVKDNINSISNNRVVTKWAFFAPSSCGLAEVGALVEKGHVRPVVEKTFNYGDLPLAFQRMEAGHLRGKLVSKIIMPEAKWNGVVIAEANANEVVMVEGNTYFPPSAIKAEYFKQNKDTSTCPWKGTCIYFDITVNGKTNPGASWVYPTPKEKAMNIKGYHAFWKGVQIG
ncbi:unnamed protein product [Allacma fusca]|uniref:Enoyl reductase (ER) domain-containing protein n=1 Tax=Allacma fusca TaxID=39272 RepID=A0A8J2P6W0_9HEXA|nr:unnamed protein product [Allacma fusca]